MVKKSIFALVTLLGIYFLFFYDTSVKQGNVLENKFFLIKWNTHKWDFNKESVPVSVIANRFVNSRGNDGTGGGASIRFDIKYKKINVSINFGVTPHNQDYKFENGVYYRPNAEIFFNKNSDYKNLKRDKYGIPDLFTHNNGNKKLYDGTSKAIVYLKGMKCLKDTYLKKSSIFEKKNTTIYCGYYDKKYGKRRFYISYDHDDVLDDKQWDEYNNTLPVSQPIENLIVDAVEKIVKDLEIKNFDKERMIKEGLYHPNKEFKIIKL